MKEPETLTELLEACGYGFRQIVLHSREDGHKWTVKAGKHYGGFTKNGKTAEGAMKKLYKELKGRNLI